MENESGHGTLEKMTKSHGILWKIMEFYTCHTTIWHIFTLFHNIRNVNINKGEKIYKLIKKVYFPNTSPKYHMQSVGAKSP